MPWFFYNLTRYIRPQCYTLIELIWSIYSLVSFNRLDVWCSSSKHIAEFGVSYIIRMIDHSSHTLPGFGFESAEHSYPHNKNSLGIFKWKQSLASDADGVAHPLPEVSFKRQVGFKLSLKSSLFVLAPKEFSFTWLCVDLFALFLN